MTFCPSCGMNLCRDEVIERDGFTLDPRGAVRFCGQAIDLTPAEAMLLHSVASCGNRVVSRSVIGSRIGDADDPANVASVILCRVRKRLLEQQVPCPVISTKGRGYRWEALA